MNQCLKDNSNWEWNSWVPIGIMLVPFFIIHSITFNIAGQFVTEQTLPYFTIVYSIIGSSIMFTKLLVFLSIVQGTFIFIAAYYFRYVFVFSIKKKQKLHK